MSGGNVEAIAMNQLAHGDVADQITEWKNAVNAKSYDKLLTLLDVFSQSGTESSTLLFDQVANCAGNMCFRVRAAFELLQRQEEARLQRGFNIAFPAVTDAMYVVQRYHLGEIDFCELLMESTNLQKSSSVAFFWDLVRESMSDLVNDLTNVNSKILADYYMALLKFDTFSGFDDAVKYFTKYPDRISFSNLAEIYSARSAWWDRCDLILIATELDSDLVNTFLSSIISSRAAPLVRSYAAVALISRGETEWIKSKNRRGRSSPFWDSLKAYANYREGNMTFAELQALAISHSTRNGDDWYWLTLPE